MNLRSILVGILSATLLLVGGGVALGDPIIDISVESFDFGTIPQHTVLEREIVIRNAGDEELLITEIYTSCPCTVLKLQEEVIAPGGRTIVEVTFFSRDFQGETSKVIEINSNDPGRDFIEIPVRAYISTPLMIYPDNRSLDFGECRQGESPNLSADFQATAVPELLLELELVNTDLFDVDLRNGVEGDPAVARLSVSIRAEAVAGPLREVIRLKTNLEDMPTVDLEICGVVQGDLEAVPAIANFRFARVGQELRREINVISSRAGVEFSIVGAEIDLPGLQAEIIEASGDQARVLIAGVPVSADDPRALENQGRVKGVLSIHTDLAAQPLIQVDVLYILRK
ncbi:MAG: DUF1573 domain-containing protein [bacterium]|nr:DUF1573 domain-containing protein [bacterium]